MSISEMLGQSAVLTLLGMCVVFAFLVILIACMNALRVFVHATRMDEVPAKAEVQAAVQPAATQTVDKNAVVAAIAAALHERG